MWNDLISSLRNNSIIEFGMHQMERNPDCSIWRRHDNGGRFENLHNGLFSDKGAYAACTGASLYPKKKYSATGRLVVPYVAIWERGAELAFVVRAAVPFPEITLAPTASIGSLVAVTDGELLANLASIFGFGAGQYGVRWLTGTDIAVPQNMR